MKCSNCSLWKQNKLGMYMFISNVFWNIKLMHLFLHFTHNQYSRRKFREIAIKHSTQDGRREHSKRKVSVVVAVCVCAITPISLPSSDAGSSSRIRLSTAFYFICETESQFLISFGSANMYIRWFCKKVAAKKFVQKALFCEFANASNRCLREIHVFKEKMKIFRQIIN